MGKSNIQWTDETDNIIVAVDDESGEQRGWWCRKISPGCTFCYAEALNDSEYFGGNHLKYAGAPPVLMLREDIIASWTRQRKPRRHFVMSMSDVFGDWVPRAWIFIFLDGMRAAARQIFQVLTKRADIMRREVLAWLEARGLTEVPPNIHLGVTVEDQERANLRIPELLQIPCSTRFLSVEPLLGDVDLTPWLARGIHWVIVGGESHRKRSKARIGFVPYIRSVVLQCISAGVPVFVKQLGSNVVDRNDAGFQGDEPTSWPMDTNVVPFHGREYQGDPVHVRLRDRKGGDWDEWPADLRIRELPHERSHEVAA